MSDETKRDHDGPAKTLARREFLATTAAVGIAVATGAVACDAEAHDTEQGKSTTAKAEAPKTEPDASSPVEPMDEKPQPVAEKIEKVDERPKVGPGRVVMVTHPGATENIKKINQEVVAKMVSEAMVKLTGAKDAAAAMASFVKKDDMVGIKVNTLGSPFAATTPEVAFAIADLVHATGVPKNHIFIYDQYGSRMKKAKYRPQREGQRDPKDDYAVHFHETLGYEEEKVETGGINKNNMKPGTSAFPKLLKKLTAVINVCVPKDHDLTGITGALKNVAYGNLDRVPIYHCKPECNPKCVHDGKCNVARIYKHPELGGKVRLVICDALRVLYNGGPQDNMTHKAAYNSILASTDPVAVDRLILEIINGLRAEKKNLKPIEEDRGGKRNPRFLAGATALGLGESDMKKIKWEKHQMS